MGYKFSVDDGVVAFEYGKLCRFGVQGALRTPPVEERELYRRVPRASVAAVRREPTENPFASNQREFLAIFYFEPPIDATVVRGQNSDSSIVTCGLNKAEARSCLDELILALGFAPRHNPSQEFVAAMRVEFPVEVATYSVCANICRIFPAMKLEKVFGTCHYANFLHRYKQVSEEEGLRVASERFNTEMPRL